MDPVTAALIGILLIVLFGGYWGTLIIRNILEQRSARLRPPGEGARLEEIIEDYRLLEGRLGRLEEEVEFLRQLRDPSAQGALPAADREEGEE